MINAVIMGCQLFCAPGVVISRRFLSLLAVYIDDKFGSGRERVCKRVTNCFELSIIGFHLFQNLWIIYLCVRVDPL